MSLSKLLSENGFHYEVDRLLVEELRKHRFSNWLLWFRYWVLKRELSVALCDAA